jgi:hypothetical protein
MMKLFTKVALVTAVAGLAMAGTAGDSFARGYKAKSYCVPGTWRVAKSTCGSWGCHYQKCIWTGTPQTSWMISPAFCLHPWCPKY